MPMNGIRKSSSPPAVLLASACRTSWTDSTRRSPWLEELDTPARLGEGLRRRGYEQRHQPDQAALRPGLHRRRRRGRPQRQRPAAGADARQHRKRAVAAGVLPSGPTTNVLLSAVRQTSDGGYITAGQFTTSATSSSV